ncbi:MAG: type II/IV secretion system protein [Patescibacteria group bacterium]
MPKFDEQKVEEKLHALHLEEEEQIALILSKKYNLPYLNLDTITIDASAVSLVPESGAHGAELAVFQTVGKKIKVAIRNPNSDAAKGILEELKRNQYKPQVYMVSRHSLEKAWERYKEARKAKPFSKGIVTLIDDEMVSNAVINSLDQLREHLEPFIQSEEERHLSLSFELLLKGALLLDASDIHIEEEEQKTRLRLRLDGILHDVIFFSQKAYKLLLSRIKLLSGLKLNVRERAQDGRFTIRVKEGDIEVRTSTLPGPYGESIVMRILSPQTIALSMEDLGMQKPVFNMMIEELNKPNGLILTTGPTGSGKTTTLYAFLKRVNSPGVNIITIEDPIEYHLAGINQTQVDTERGYDFSNGLRSILRQDPDIILVGEIRDRETAEIGMHAALTGHLVFSTLHTNNAPGTIPRLTDLGVQPNIIAPAINIAMAQRLVRRLCSVCKEEYKLSGDELKQIEHAVADLPSVYKKPPQISENPVWRAKGCGACNNTGYKGRVGVFEVFSINDEIERMILELPSEASVRQAAKQQGMLTIQQDGALKTLAGITSWDEVVRVTGE